MKLRSVPIRFALTVVLGGVLGAPSPAPAQPAEHQVVLDAREALRKKDRIQLASASVAARVDDRRGRGPVALPQGPRRRRDP